MSRVITASLLALGWVVLLAARAAGDELEAAAGAMSASMPAAPATEAPEKPEAAAPELTLANYKMEV
ncbi:hypothetical protein H4S02_002395, partial [Coemansia sp. RSA 2611]